MSTCVLVCAHFAPEMRAVLEAPDFRGGTSARLGTFPAQCCGRPIDAEGVARMGASHGRGESGRGESGRGKCHVDVFGSACCAGLTETPGQSTIHRLGQCFDLVAPPPLVDHLLRSGAYLVTPGWLAHWRARLAREKFDETTARLMFRESSTKIVLLDTGVDRDARTRLVEFAAFVGLPSEVLPVGLDYVRATLAALVNRRRLDDERATSLDALTVANRQSADYATAFDLVNTLPECAGERDVLQQTLDVFVMMLAPRFARIVSIRDGVVGVSVSNVVDGSDAAAFSPERVWSVSEPRLTDRGFIVPVRHDGQLLAVAQVDELDSIEHLPQALVFAVTVASVTGLAIVSARRLEAARSAEQALRERDYFFQESQRAARIGSYKLDFATGEWQSSEVLDLIFGIGHGYARDIQGWLALVHPDDAAALERYLAAEVVGRHLSFDKEYRIVRPSDGAARWVHGHGEVTYDAAGNAVSMTGTIQDATERRRAEEVRQSLQEQLIQSQKMEAVGQLAGGIAHDFNNILAAMTLQLNLLRMEPSISQAALADGLGELLHAATRATNLTQQLLLFSRRQVMKTGRHDVNQIVRDLSRLVGRLLGEQVTLRLELHDSALWLDCDVNMIEQVITNLCVNARDAMPHGGHITITTTNVGRAGVGGGPPVRHVCLRVADSGLGIEPAVLQRIFEPFFTTKERGKGTGLGLSTVHGIVTKHGGAIEVDSVVGRGTTFSLYLPSAARGELAPGQHAGPSPIAGGTERILVVEDEDAVRRMVVRLLSRLGYHVVEATNADHAVDVFAAHEGAFDLVFTDMVMPGKLTGVELCQQLRRLRPELKAIVASGYSAEILDSSSLVSGEIAYLSKPYEVGLLARTLRACFDGGVAPNGRPLVRTALTPS